jgi:hypothetical protein
MKRSQEEISKIFSERVMLRTKDFLMNHRERNCNFEKILVEKWKCDASREYITEELSLLSDSLFSKSEETSFIGRDIILLISEILHRLKFVYPLRKSNCLADEK